MEDEKTKLKPVKIITVPLTEPEKETFEKAHIKSGMRSEADFVRFLVAQYDRMTIMKG